METEGMGPYLDAVKDIVDRLTPDQVNNSDRFKTIWG